MKILTAGLLYFVVVFGIGFAFGIVRTLWVTPHVGAQAAELLEMPLMAAVMVFAARWVIRWFAIPPDALPRAAMGGFALVLLFGAESGLTLWLRGISWKDYVASKDPVAALAYGASLVLFAVMPLIVNRRETPSDVVRSSQDGLLRNA